jgi:hypothetical protein
MLTPLAPRPHTITSGGTVKDDTGAVDLPLGISYHSTVSPRSPSGQA